MNVTGPNEKKVLAPVEQKPPPPADGGAAKKKPAVDLGAMPSLTSAPNLAEFYKLAMQSPVIGRSGGDGAHAEIDAQCIAETAHIVTTVLAEGGGHAAGKVVAHVLAPPTVGGSFAIKGVVGHGVKKLIEPTAHEVGTWVGTHGCPNVTVIDVLPKAPPPLPPGVEAPPPFDGPTPANLEYGKKEAHAKAEEEAKMSLPTPAPTPPPKPAAKPVPTPAPAPAPKPAPKAQLSTPIVQPGTYSPIDGGK